jgi:hypothetical protein
MPRWFIAAVIVSALLAAVTGVWLALHQHADKPTPFPLRLVEVTHEAGIRFRHFNGMTGKKLLPETMGSGVAVIDYDRDGNPDLFFVNSRPWPGQPGVAFPALYRNTGTGTFEDRTVELGLDVQLYGLGVTIGDYDNDGWPDLFVTAIGQNYLFHNERGHRFRDVTAEAGVGGNQTWPQTSADGFLRHTEPIPFPASAAWLDYDLDGLLDLFVCQYLTWSPAIDLGVQAVLPNRTRAYVPPTQFPGVNCVLYHNLGSSRFEDVSATMGIRIEENGVPVAKALGVVVCDPDRDGYPDIAVACDMTRNLFYHNVPGVAGGRRFEEIGLAANVAYAEGRPRGGMGIDATELWPDILAIAIVNFSNEPNTLLRLRSTQPLGFSDIAVSSGLAGLTRLPMKFGAMFLDLNLDGRADFFTCNGHLEPDIATAQPGQTYPQAAQLFFNTGNASHLWDPAGPDQVGPDIFQPIVGRGCAYLDYDGDGDLDIVVTENGGPARLFRNDNATGHHWIALRLVGNGTTCNRDAIGAEITVEAGGRTWRHYVTSARGYLSQSDLVATFGLGNLAAVDRVTVRWPESRGQTQTWVGLEIDKLNTLVQPIPQ